MSEPLDLTRVASSLEGYGDDDTAWVAAGLVRALLAELKQSRALLREARVALDGVQHPLPGPDGGCDTCWLITRIHAALAGGGGE